MPGETTRFGRGANRYARLVLERAHGNKRRACDILRISYHTLQAHLNYLTAASGDPCAETAHGVSQIGDRSSAAADPFPEAVRLG